MSAKAITRLRGHTDQVTCAVFSANGTRIVTASRDNTARIWDAVSAKAIAILRGHRSSVTSAAFSPDGRRIVTASRDNTARIWDAASAKKLLWYASRVKEIAVLRNDDPKFDSVNSAAFSPDGSLIVTASDDQTARIWDVASAEEIAILRGHESDVTSAAFSPDGRRIVTASSDKTARIWDARSTRHRIHDGTSLEEIAILRGHTEHVTDAAFSPDGARIVIMSNGQLRMWDVASAKEIAVLPEDRNWPHSDAASSPDGTRIVKASSDNTAGIWDAASGKKIAVLRGHNGRVYSARFSPDGRRIVSFIG